MMRKITFTLFLSALLTLWGIGDAHAQKFLKNLSNAIEKAASAVDKATDEILGTSSTTTSPVATANSSESSTEAAVAIVPYITGNTKKVYVNHTSGLEIVGNLSEGVMWVCDGKTNDGKFNSDYWVLYDTLGNATGLTWTNSRMGMGYTTQVPRFHKGVALFPYYTDSDNRGVNLVRPDGTPYMSVEKVYPCSQFNNIGIAVGRNTRMPKGGYSMSHEIYSVVYYDTRGAIVLENISSDVKERLLDEIDNIGVRNMVGNRMAYYDYQERLWGFLDQNFNIAIPPRYKRVQDFSDGLAAVLDDSGNWGYINAEGNTVIAHNFTKQPTSFRDGYAKVEKRNGRFAYINKKGEVVCDDMHDAGVFIGGYAYFTKKPDENSTLKIHRIDTDLNVVLADDIDKRAREVTNYTSDGTRYTRDAIVDLDGNVLLAGCRTVFTNGLAVMDYTGIEDGQTFTMKGLMRRNGEVAVLFVEKEF